MTGILYSEQVLFVNVALYEEGKLEQAADCAQCQGLIWRIQRRRPSVFNLSVEKDLVVAECAECGSRRAAPTLKTLAIAMKAHLCPKNRKPLALNTFRKSAVDLHDE